MVATTPQPIRRPHPLRGSRLANLRKSIQFSLMKLRVFRDHRMERLRAYVGTNYSDEGALEKQPINMLALATSIYKRHLVGADPQVLITTPYQQLKVESHELELGLNHLLKEINFRDTIHTAVIDALFLVGVIKVGIYHNESSGTDGGIFHNTGQPFADPVDPDDFVYDIVARRLEHVQYIGNTYRMLKEAAHDEKTFDRRQRQKLQPYEELQASGGWGGGQGSVTTRAANLSQGLHSSVEEYRPQVELYDLFLPEENVLVTMPAHLESGPLREVDWDGPERGPYHVLGLGKVPSNIMSLAPLALIQDANDLANRIFVKVARQAERQKTILAVGGQAVDDAGRVVEAGDGEVIPVNYLAGLREIRFGGPDQINTGFALQLRQLVSYLGGNLDVLGGQGPQSDTVGQDQLMRDSASEMVQDMQDQTYQTVRDVCEDLGYWLYTDPHITLPLVKRIPGTDREITFNWSPERREADFYQYNMNVEPFSLRHQSPTQRLQQLMQIFTEVLVPSMPMMQGQGMTFDMRRFLKLVSKYSNTPEVMDLIVNSLDPASPENTPVNPAQIRQSPHTTRTNVRVNRSQPTMESQEADLQRMLANAGASVN